LHAGYRHYQYITSDDYIFRDLLTALTDVPNGTQYESMDFRVYGKHPHSYLKLYFQANALTHEEFQALGYDMMERIDRYIYIGMEIPSGGHMFSDMREFSLSFVLLNATGEIFCFSRRLEQEDGLQKFYWRYRLASETDDNTMDGFYTYPTLTSEQYALWGSGEVW